MFATLRKSISDGGMKTPKMSLSKLSAKIPSMSKMLSVKIPKSPSVKSFNMQNLMGPMTMSQTQAKSRIKSSAPAKMNIIKASIKKIKK